MPPWLTSAIAAFGGTIFTFGIFGVAVDWWFKRELAEDVFRAAVGYLLPEELREEMKWIYAQHIICEEHLTLIDLVKLDPPLMLMKVKTYRKLKNVGSSTEAVKPSVSVDEWLHKSHHSRIIEVGYIHGSKREVIYSCNASYDALDSTLSLSFSNEIILKPNEEIIIWREAEKVKQQNDLFYHTLSYATRSPNIKVTPPDSIQFQVGFAHRNGSGIKTGAITQLSGTLLPTQHVAVRWWDKEAAEEWLAAEHTDRP